MTEGAYLVPQTAFVGDAVRLTVPLPAGFAKGSALMPSARVFTDKTELPATETIIVNRVEVNYAQSKLIIDFCAFQPGEVVIPEFRAGGIDFPSFTVPIASILEADGFSAELSPPERPLAAPGTFALIIGGVSGIVIFLLCAVIFASRGPKYLRRAAEFLRIRLTIARSVRRCRLIQRGMKSGRQGIQESLAKISAELKSFLGFLYRENYAAYSAEDFLRSPFLENKIHFFDGTDGALFRSADNSGCFPLAYNILSVCDRLRFSGTQCNIDKASRIIQKMISYIKTFKEIKLYTAAQKIKKNKNYVIADNPVFEKQVLKKLVFKDAV